jgi:hypothetical protein
MNFTNFVMLRLAGANPYMSMANFSKPSAPAAPDYVGAAQAQGIANVEAARASSKLSNPNITNPYGSRTVTYGINGDADQAQVNETLSPEGQKLFDQNNRVSQGLGNLAEGGIGRVGSMLGTQFDMSQVPGQAKAGQQGWDNAYNAIIQRHQPQADRQKSMLDTQLANQGIMQGSEAYKNAQDDFARSQNDFQLGAQQQATGQQQAQYGMDQSARQDAISQQAYLRQLPLNEINALRSGAQVNVPQFQQFSGQQIQAAPIFAGTQAQGQADLARYNAESAQSGNFMSGLMGLGGAVLGAPTGSLGAGLFSDARLKDNIKRVGQTDSGLPIYTYTYKGSNVSMMGVMAQEVMEKNPDAVMQHESGYLMVDYSKVQ